MSPRPMKRFQGNYRIKAPDEDDITEEVVNEARACFNHLATGWGKEWSRCKQCSAYRVQARLYSLGYWARQRDGIIKTNAPKQILEHAIALPKTPGIAMRQYTWDWAPTIKDAPKAKHVYLFEVTIVAPVEIAADNVEEAAEAWEMYREGIRRVVDRDIGPMPRVHSHLREIDGYMLPQPTQGALV